jgi:hypothetical protein
MDEQELLSLLKSNISISLEVIHIDNYGVNGIPYSDNKLKISLKYNGEMIDYDTISLNRLNIRKEI